MKAKIEECRTIGDLDGIILATHQELVDARVMFQQENERQVKRLTRYLLYQQRMTRKFEALEAKRKKLQGTQ